jgi:hypothetical protein
MYISMYGCDRYGYVGNPDREAMCTTPDSSFVGAPVFFMVYILVATFVMLNLFVGVVVIAMEQSSKEVAEYQEELRKVAEVIQRFGWTVKQMKQARIVYYMINTDGQGGIEVGELSEAMALAGIDVSMAELEATVFEIGGEDMSIGLAEWIEFVNGQSSKTAAEVQAKLHETLADLQESSKPASPGPLKSPKPEPHRVAVSVTGEKQRTEAAIEAAEDAMHRAAGILDCAGIDHGDDAMHHQEAAEVLVEAGEVALHALLQLESPVAKPEKERALALARAIMAEFGSPATELLPIPDGIELGAIQPQELPPQVKASAEQGGDVAIMRARRPGRVAETSTSAEHPQAKAKTRGRRKVKEAEEAQDREAQEVEAQEVGEVMKEEAPVVEEARAMEAEANNDASAMAEALALKIDTAEKQRHAARLNASTLDGPSDFFKQCFLGKGMSQAVFPLHDDLPCNALLLVTVEGVQFISAPDSVLNPEPTLLLAVTWRQVAFWTVREQPPADGLPSRQLLLLGIQEPDSSVLAGVKYIRRVQSVVKMEVDGVGPLRSSLQQYRPFATQPPELEMSQKDRALEDARARGQFDRAMLANAPSCLLFPLPSQLSAMPEEAAMRVCTLGVQVTTIHQFPNRSQVPRVVRSWRWEDVVFWRFLPGAEDDALDIFLLGIRDTSQVDSTPGVSGPEIALFRAEIEETEETQAMLEVYCPSFGDHETSIAAGATHANLRIAGFCHERTAFEVFAVSSFPASQEFGCINEETQMRMLVDAQYGVALYDHEGNWGFRLLQDSSRPQQARRRWQWRNIGRWGFRHGIDGNLDLFHVEILADGEEAFVALFEAEDGAAVEACFNAAAGPAAQEQAGAVAPPASAHITLAGTSAVMI